MSIETMGFFEALILAFAIGFGLFFGLNALGREIPTGLVEAAKTARGDDVKTPDANG